MKIRYYPEVFKGAGVITIAFLFIVSCKKLPEPAFSFSPIDNPEAGETIQFTNESLDATSFSWEYGDGASSTLENPEHIYEEAGIFSVKLLALNESGEESIIQAITIYEPTILGFVVGDSIGENIFSDAEVWVYDNQSDWENTNEPLLKGITDNDGLVYFEHMESIVYHIWAFKYETGGLWLFGGFTSSLELNEINLFNVPCSWLPDAKKSSPSFKGYIKPNGPDCFWAPFQLIGTAD